MQSSHFCGLYTWQKCKHGEPCYLFEIEEEAGVLAGLWEVGEKHCDTDEEHRGVLAHFTQRLDERTARAI